LLYRPVKTSLEGLGFVVKGEIGGCDLFALRGDGPPVVVIGELKLTFNLELVLQGVDRCSPELDEFELEFIGTALAGDIHPELGRLALEAIDAVAERTADLERRLGPPPEPVDGQVEAGG
jgi:hypothetical protein